MFLNSLSCLLYTSVITGFVALACAAMGGNLFDNNLVLGLVVGGCLLTYPMFD